MKDVERIIKAAELIEENPRDGWIKQLLWKIREVSLMLLEKILPFLDSSEVGVLYDYVYEFLGKVFRVDTDYMMPNRSSGESLIYLIASKYRLEVTIKRL